MDQQTPKKPAPTAEEIARLEAEAARALSRGEAPATRAPRAEAPEADGPDAPARPDFVPYVDDVPEPAPAAEAAEDDDDDEGEYIPGEWEKRIDALSPESWRLWQIVGGAAVGLAAVACLFVFGEELSAYGLIVAALLALLLPRYLERVWRRKLTTARYAMAAAMLAGLIIIGVVIAARGGLKLTK